MARRRTDALVVVAVGLVVPIACTAAGGGFGIPRNDDWSHARTMFDLVRTGHLRLTGWSPATLVGQLLVAYPVVSWWTSRSTLQLVTLVEGVVGLGCMLGVARTVVPRRDALVAAVAVALTPLWIPLVASFMTDVPAATGAFGAAWCTCRSVGRRDARGFLSWGAAGLAAGVWAMSVRQSCAVVPLVVSIALVVAILTERRSDVVGADQARFERSAVLVMIGIAGVAAVGFLWWRTSLVHGTLWVDSQVGSSIWFTVRHVDRLAFSLGLLVVPVVACSRPARVVRRSLTSHRWWAVSTAGVIVVDLTRHLTAGLDETLLGDYATRAGSYPAAVRGSAVYLLPSWAWVAVLTAAACSLWIAGLIVRDLPLGRMARAEPTRLTVVAGLPVAALVLILVTWPLGHHPFDRYLLVVVPFVAVLLRWGPGVLSADGVVDDRAAAGAEPSAVRSADARSGVGGRLVVVACATLAIYFGVASAQSDRARWDAAVVVHRRFGVPDDQIFAGLEWIGAHATTPRGAPWYVISNATMCALVRQYPSRRSGNGVVVGHTSLLGVDRWFEVTSTGKCAFRLPG